MTNSQKMIKVFTVEEMVAAEKAADAAGVSYDQMMETAGQSVAEAIRRRYPVDGQQILILVGPGNNGGDGLVAGRHLAQMGSDVLFYLYRSRNAQEDANYALIQERGWPVLLASEDEGYRELGRLVRQADIVIDSLLGTGVDRPIDGELAGLMEAVQTALAEREATPAGAKGWLTSTTTVAPPSPLARPVIVAVDCPSGLNTDSGELDPLAFPAELTVTFAGPKRGHFIFPGAAAIGELVVADIGISPQLAEVDAVSVVLATAALAAELLPARPVSGHKGTFGKVLIAAGSGHYWGAPLLCGRGAYRSGSGLVAVAVPQKLRPVVAGQLPEATYPPVPDETDWSTQGADFLLEQLDGYDALLFGPGLGEATDFVERLLASEQAPPPLIVDADGLNTLARMPDWPERLPENSVLTPHPGEMARLVGVSLAELEERERVALTREKAAEWQQVVLLKGAFTVVAAPDGRCTLLPFANPALSTAGSGDVLSGVIVSLLGQGLSSYEAAVLGGYLHGAAGHLAGEQVGQAGLLAGEIADWLPEVRRRLAS